MLYLNQKGMSHVPYLHNTLRGGAPEERRNVCTSGCGLCCACMAVEHLTIHTPDIFQMVHLSETHKANAYPGTNMRVLGPVVAQQYGLTYAHTADQAAAVQCLQQGGRVIACVNNKPPAIGLFTMGEHYILLIGIKDGEFCILDPSLEYGKFDTPARAGRVRVDTPFIYCPADTLAQETATATSHYHLFSRIESK